MIERILQGLACSGNDACKDSVRRGRGLTHCPAHDDPDPSLNVEPGSDGSVLVHCHGGCSQKDVIAALREKGMWRRSLTRTDQSVDVAPTASVSSLGPVVAEYVYEDRDGKPLYTVTRYYPKDFRANPATSEEERVLYHLPEVIAGVATKQTIFVCEGEKDADALRGLGVIATTAPFGAGKFLERYAQDLIGANVVVCQDKDELNPKSGRREGEHHARDVAQKLSVGARTVKILEFPGKGKDAADWVEAGGTLMLLQVLVEELSEWQSGEKVIWTPRDLALEYREIMHKRKNGDPAYIGWKVGMPSLDRELVYASGDMWLIAAGTGVGKSTFLQTLEARATVPTIMFTVEMSRLALMDRAMSAATRVDSWKIRRGALSTDEFKTIMTELDDFERNDDHMLVDVAGLTTSSLEQILRVARVKYGVRVAYLDYIQKLADKGDDGYSRVTAISNAVARIARQTETCIVAACQVSRDAKDGEPPLRKHLRDSGYLEQDAAVIIALGRADEQTETKVAIRKSRFGMEGFSDPLVFDPLHSRFIEKSEARRDRADARGARD